MTYKIEILLEKYPNDIHIFYNKIYYINLKNNLEKYRNNFKSFLYAGDERKYKFSDKYIDAPNEIIDLDVLVFEFETEEEAFYFKMKFC